MGKWIMIADDEPLVRMCSDCGMPAVTSTVDLESSILTPFCPWCGSEMGNNLEEQERIDVAASNLREQRRLELKAAIEADRMRDK